MLIRSVAGIVRGNATPFQLSAACILGAMIGFVPGFLNAPGLLLTLLLLLAVLNANLGVAALVGALAYLVSLAALPLSFEVGRLLLDGPTQGLFKAAINAPVLALFGFEHYVTTGGMALGLVFGIAAAVGLALIVGGFRRKMAAVEEGSERYKKYAGKRWVRALSWLILGKGKGKATYAELSGKRVGRPVRLTGVILAALIVGLLFVVQSFFSEPIVTALLKNGLERANNATVEVGKADLSLRSGKLTIQNLALADAGAADANGRIDTDLLRVANLDADVSGADLLRGRISIDKARLAGATHGQKRATPGRIIKPPPPPQPPPANQKTLDDYLAQAKVWKQRLEQVRQWLDRIDSARPQAKAPGPSEPKQETLKQRLEREAREKGYRNVVASHLIEGAPTFLVRDAVVEDLTTADAPGKKYQVHAQNISTQPWLVDQPPNVTVTSGSDFHAELALASAARTPAPSTMLVEYTGLDADRLMSQLAGSARINGKAPIQGGTVDLKLDGSIGPGPDRWIDAPLLVTLRNTTANLPQAGPTKLDLLTLPIGLRGPMSNPGVTFDDTALADALVKAGKAELANKVRGAAQKAVDKAAGEVEKKAGDILKDKLRGKLGDPLKGLLPGGNPPKDQPKDKPKQ